MRAVTAAVIGLLFISSVWAQDRPLTAPTHHLHSGEPADADWYDANCCSNNDCHLVPDPDETLDEISPGVWLYKPLNTIIDNSRVKPSKDENFHICINPMTNVILCLYIRQGA